MSATLTLNTIGTQVAGVPFQVTGTYTLTASVWIDQLQYEDNGGAFTAIPSDPVQTQTASFTWAHAGMPAGTHTVTVSDALTGAIVTSNPFTVVASSTIVANVPTNVVANQSFTFTGSLTGFSVAPALQYHLDGGAAITMTGVTTSAWSMAITAPGTLGNHTLVVQNGAQISNTVSFPVAAPPTTIVITAIPGTTVAGSTITFAGTLTGYLAIPHLTYRLDAVATQLAVTGVTLTGWQMALPAPAAGPHTITVSDGTTTVSLPFTTVAAPKTITPFAPTSAQAGQSFTFQGVLTNYTAIPALTYVLDAAAPVTMKGVTTTGWSMTVTIPTAGSHTMVVSDGTFSGTVTFTVQPAVTPTATRNWFENPGEDGMFWTKPFQTSANWITSGALVTALRNGANSVPTGVVNVKGNFATPWVIGQASDPVVKVTDGTHTIFVHIPLGTQIEAPSSPFDQSIGGADSTQPYLVWSISGATMTDASGSSIGSVQASGTVITGTYGFAVQDGSGKIMIDAVTGAPGDNNSIGGLQDLELTKIRTDPNYVIPHMLAYHLDKTSQVSASGPIWPLAIIDTSGANTGPLPQGLTIGIPAGVGRPPGKTRGFYAWFDQLQQQGALFYNVSDAGATLFVVYSNDSANASLVTDLTNTLSDVMQYVCILNYDAAVPGSQTSLGTQKGFVPGAVDAFPSPPILDLSPTGGVNVLPSTFGAWYPSGYNVAPANTSTGGTTPTVIPSPWDSATIAGPTTLSTDAYTASAGGTATPGTAKQGVRAKVAVDPTKIVLWEISMPAVTQDWAAGVADTSIALATLGGLGDDLHGIGAYPSTGAGSQPPQTVYFNNSQLSAGNGIADVAGDVMTIVANGTNFYFSTPSMRQTSGVAWNNSSSANPATNNGGFSFIGMGAPRFPVFGTTESGGIATINDGTKALSAFAAAFLSANPSVVTLSGQTPPAAARAITPAAPSSVVTNQPFNFTGTIAGYVAAPNLTFQIGNGAPTPLTGVTSTSWSMTLTIPAAGSTTISVTDGTVTGQVTFNVTAAGGAPQRIVAPLTGTVPLATGNGTTNGWNALDVTFPGVTMPSGKPAHCNYLLPANYDPTKVYPILFWLHPDEQTTGWYDGSNTNPYQLVNDDINTFYNTVSFRTNYPCIIVAPYCDQSTASDAVENFGGWVNNGQTGSGTVSSGNTGPNVFANLGWAAYFLSHFSGDPTRVYVNGFSLGGIGTEYLMLKYNLVNGLQKVFAAGVSYAGVLEINGFGAGPTTADVTASTAPPTWFVSGVNDTTSVPTHWNTLLWQRLAGNTNYPVPGGTAAQAQAGTSNYHFWYVPGLGHDQSTFPTNTTLLNWMFSQIGSVTNTLTLTGANLSSSSVSSGSATGTVVGQLSVQATGGTPTGVTFGIASQSTAGAFAISGVNLVVGTGAPTVGAYAVSIRVTATNAVNSPQTYTLNVSVVSAAAKTPAALIAYLNTIKGNHVISGQFIETGLQAPGGITPINNIQASTGNFLGAIFGDYWHYNQSGPPSTNINQTLINYWNAGGLVGLSFMMPNPTTGGGVADTSTVNAGALLTPGSATNNALNASIDGIGAGLLALQTAGVTALLIRPYHEMNGNWFWYGTGFLSDAQFVALWQYTFNRWTNAGITNLVKVFAMNAGIAPGSGLPINGRYPGNTFVDVVATDLYTSNPSIGQADYNYMSTTFPTKLIAMGEFGAGAPGLGDLSFPMTTLTNLYKNSMPNLVYWTNWWDGNGGNTGWGMGETLQSALPTALNDPRVLNRGEITFFNA